MARRTEQQNQAARTMGRNSVPVYAGVENVPLSSQIGYIESLGNKPLLAEMERMWYLDETVGAMAFCIQTTMGQARWSHVPHIDGRPDETGNEDAKWAADFCNSLLEDMEETTIADHIEDAITMIPLGFAPCEIVTKQRIAANDSRFRDAYWGIKRLPLRDQFSVVQWVYNGENPVAFRQIGIGGTGTVPLWKTLHYRASQAKNNPNGRPFLANAHRAYTLKVKMQDSEAIGIERDLCGLPTFRIPQDVMDEANQVDENNLPTDAAKRAQAKVAAAIKAVSDLRFNKSGGLVMPSDTWSDDVAGDRTPKWDFKLITTAGQRSIDVRTAIRDYDRAIARVLMMQFLHLGDRSTGSFALSADQSDIGVRALQSFANRICDQWNLKLIRLIWTVNGFDPRYMPKLQASELNKDGISQVGKFLADIGRGADLWESDDVVRRALLRLGNLPFNPEAQRVAAEMARKRKENEASKPVQQKLPFGGQEDQQT